LFELIDTNTWASRENEIYNSEKRLLFFCQSEEECATWVCVLKWLIEPVSTQEEGNEEEFGENDETN
jgi:hypothetical protein